MANRILWNKSRLTRMALVTSVTSLTLSSSWYAFNYYKKDDNEWNGRKECNETSSFNSKNMIQKLVLDYVFKLLESNSSITFAEHQTEVIGEEPQTRTTSKTKSRTSSPASPRVSLEDHKVAPAAPTPKTTTTSASATASAAEKNWWDEPEYAPKSYHGKWDKDWLDSKKYKGTRYIVLVRHGQYANESSNNEDIKTLTPVGEKQAFYTGEYLTKLIGVTNSVNDDDSFVVPISTPSDIKVISSDLIRAKQTATIISKAMSHGAFGKLDIELDPDLQEGFPCVPSPINPSWLKSITETERKEDPERISRAFKRYFTPKQSEGSEVVILVNHGNVIRFMLCKALQIPEEAWLRFSVANGSVSIIAIRPSGNVSVRCIGDFGSIPTSHATFKNIK